MKLTRIQAGVRDPSRCNLYVDDRFLLAVPAEAVVEFKLQKGQDIDGDMLDALSAYDQQKRALACAMELLSRRSHGRAELQQKLAQRGYDRQVAEDVSHQLARQGYVDDECHAQMLYDHLRQKGWGAMRIRQEMRAKGLDPQVIDQVLEQREDPDEEVIRGLIEKKLRFGSSADPKLKRRLEGMLQRYGYRFDQFRHILDEYFDEGEEEWR